MAQTALRGNLVNTVGDLPAVGSKAPDFELVGTDLGSKTLSDFAGKRVILNIFPSLDTGICAASVRAFNSKAGNLDNTVVLCISKDLPFAHKRFCTTEGLDNVVSLSDFRNKGFEDDYGVRILDGPMEGLHARTLVIVGTEGTVLYSQIAPEITEEHDYDAAIAVL